MEGTGLHGDREPPLLPWLCDGTWMSGGRVWGPRSGDGLGQQQRLSQADPETWVSIHRDLVSRQRAGQEARGQADEEIEPRGEEQALRPETQGLRVLKPGWRVEDEVLGRDCWRLMRVVL